MHFIRDLFSRPKIVAAFSYRFDAELIPDMKKNLEGIVDEYVENDDRKNDVLWYHEGETRRRLIDMAKAKGADWILGIDPDERFELNAAEQIRELVKVKQKVIYNFHFCELWEPDKFRIDGIWGDKKKRVLFPVYEDQKFMNLKVHSAWHPINEDYTFVDTNIRLYHLKMIDPVNRVARRDLYNSLDKDKKIQAIGYDYLADEAGLELQKIEKGREYFPSYKRSYKIRQRG